MATPPTYAELQQEVQRLHDRLVELEDLRQINELAARYHTLCDGGWADPSHQDVEALVQLWVPDGSYRINRARPAVVGHDEIRAQFVRLQTSMPWIFHTFTNSEITRDTPTTARGQFKGVAYYRRQGGAHIVTAVYRGEFVKLPQGWRFKSWAADIAHGSVLDPTIDE